MDFPFRMDYQPSVCTYIKQYTWSAVAKIGGASAATSWLSIIDAAEQENPVMRINSSTTSHELWYIVTIKAKLYDEAPDNPSVSFEVYLHESACIKATLTGLSPLSMLTVGTTDVLPHSYQISYEQVAQNREFV